MIDETKDMLLKGHARLANNLALSAYMIEDAQEAILTAIKHYRSFAVYITHMEDVGFVPRFFRDIGVVKTNPESAIGIDLYTQSFRPPEIKDKSHIRPVLTACTRDIGLVLLDTEMSDRQKHSAIKAKFWNLSKLLKDSPVLFTEVHKDELELLGFNPWSSTKHKIRMIPLWAAYCFKGGEHLVNFKGDTVIPPASTKDIPLRVGCVSWGIPV